MAISSPSKIEKTALPGYDSRSPDKQQCLDFYCEEEKIRARFYCSPGCRVLDTLNKNHSCAPEQDVFIGLTNNINHEEFYIHRDAVMFVAADNINTGRGLGGSEHKQYPVVKKTQERISIQMKSYLLTGKAHLAKNMTLKAALAENLPFLPLTEVMIIHKSKLIDQRPFVAVNKRKIVSVKKEFS